MKTNSLWSTTETAPRHDRVSGLSANVATAIESELGLRVRGLSVAEIETNEGPAVLITGTASSYHQKQLASRAAMLAVRDCESLQVRNDLDVTLR